MAEPAEPSNYTTDETGKMTPVMPTDTTGGRIQRMLQRIPGRSAMGSQPLAQKPHHGEPGKSL